MKFRHEFGATWICDVFNINKVGGRGSVACLCQYVIELRAHCFSHRKMHTVITGVLVI